LLEAWHKPSHENYTAGNEGGPSPRSNSEIRPAGCLLSCAHNPALDEDDKIESTLGGKASMSLVRQGQSAPQSTLKVRLSRSSQVCLKIRDIIPFRITTFRRSGSPLKTWDSNPIYLHTLTQHCGHNSQRCTHLRKLPGGGGPPFQIFAPSSPGCASSPVGNGFGLYLQPGRKKGRRQLPVTGFLSFRGLG
jgi:hypothetical protein